MIMRQAIAYMLTWTTYGSWLQGDERGYVKDGMILPANPALNRANRAVMTALEVTLTPRQKAIVQDALRKEAAALGQKICAVAVGKKHVHLVITTNGLGPGHAVSHYKNAARLAVRGDGFAGRLWTRGYSKRYCFDEQQLYPMIEYVNRHNTPESPPGSSWGLNGRRKPPRFIVGVNSTPPKQEIGERKG